mgnify:CR=1 FL=1
MSKKSIRFFNDREVRAVWDEEHSKWWFSATDIVRAVNDEDDYVKAGNYWRWLKKKLATDGVQLVSVTHDFKFQAPDGKQRYADALDAECVQMLAKNYPNNRANKFLEWFTYSDNSIDGQSKKKAYMLIESGLLDSMEPGTVKCLQQIHAYLFGGLYDFAGQIRTKTIWKDGTLFCRAEYLMQNLRIIEAMPETTFDEIVSKYVEMNRRQTESHQTCLNGRGAKEEDEVNVAHPFMEGNGRSTRIWLDLIFKKRLKLCVDWSQIDKKEYLAAMRKSTTDASGIRTLLKGAMTDKIDDREIFMKGIDYSYYYEQEE